MHDLLHHFSPHHSIGGSIDVQGRLDVHVRGLALAQQTRHTRMKTSDEHKEYA